MKRGKRHIEAGPAPSGGAARAPTMMDVAAAAGVSQTTVSLVLNNVRGARLSTQTRARVREAALELGYALAGGGKAPQDRSGSSVIGFMADEISTDPWCAMELDAVREKAWEHGLTVAAAVTQGNPELEAAVLVPMLRLPLMGLIYSTVLTRRIHRQPVFSRLPTVLVNCYVPDHSVASVVPGELVGGYVATLCLLRAGHRRIAHIHGQSWTDPSRDRLKGYRRALAEYDILFDPALVRPGNWEPSAGHAETLALMDLAEPPTAIFCASDMTAFGCYQALQERGLRVPQDVSVVGYDDREIAQFMRPALTTVILPHTEMGTQAAETLIDNVLHPEGRQPQIKVECTLVERSSVGPPPG